MTYDEFKKKRTGKYCDFDGAYGNQCWDLAQFYFTEVLGLSSSILSGCGLVSNMLKEPKQSVLLKYFDEVKKADIQKGDVVIWNYGHIAIFDHKTDGVNFYFSQNPNAPIVMRVNNNTYRVFRKKGTKSTVTYYAKYTGKSKSLVDALKSLKIDSSFSNRGKIAKKNGISVYLGTASQNTKLLDLLKKGKLVK